MKKKVFTKTIKEFDIKKKYVSCCKILFLLSVHGEIMKKRSEVEKKTFSAFVYSFLTALQWDDDLCERCAKFYLSLKRRFEYRKKQMKKKKES